MTQYHNIPPVYDKNSRILILGSFPSVKSREAQFFYGHPQNRFWKVMSAVLDCDLPVTVQQKKLMLLSHNIAVWDVIGSCEITGSSDATISSVVPNDIAGLVAETSVKQQPVVKQLARQHHFDFGVLYAVFAGTDVGSDLHLVGQTVQDTGYLG